MNQVTGKQQRNRLPEIIGALEVGLRSHVEITYRASKI